MQISHSSWKSLVAILRGIPQGLSGWQEEPVPSKGTTPSVPQPLPLPASCTGQPCSHVPCGTLQTAAFVLKDTATSSGNQGRPPYTASPNTTEDA